MSPSFMARAVTLKARREIGVAARPRRGAFTRDWRNMMDGWLWLLVTGEGVACQYRVRWYLCLFSQLPHVRWAGAGSGIRCFILGLFIPMFR